MLFVFCLVFVLFTTFTFVDEIMTLHIRFTLRFLIHGFVIKIVLGTNRLDMRDEDVILTAISMKFRCASDGTSPGD